MVQDYNIVKFSKFYKLLLLIFSGHWSRSRTRSHDSETLKIFKILIKLFEIDVQLTVIDVNIFDGERGPMGKHCLL